jgi:hypothetical protein
MTAIPPEAVTAAIAGFYDDASNGLHARMRAALEAAAPLITAAERERQGREDSEFQDRFHYCPTCGGDMTIEPSRVIAEAVAAERERIRQLAITVADRSVKNGFDATALIRFAADLIAGDSQPADADSGHDPECGAPTVLGGHERPCQMPPGHDGPHLRKPVSLDEMRGHRG